MSMIHQYKLGGYNIVLDVCSGSVHVAKNGSLAFSYTGAGDPTSCQ